MWSLVDSQSFENTDKSGALSLFDGTSDILYQAGVIHAGLYISAILFGSS